MVVLRYVAGIAFLILGVIGLFLPVLQGTLFIFIGLAILFPRNRYVEQLITRARNRWPERTARIDACKERLRVFFQGLGKGGSCREWSVVTRRAVFQQPAGDECEVVGERIGVQAFAWEDAICLSCVL